MTRRSVAGIGTGDRTRRADSGPDGDRDRHGTHSDYGSGQTTDWSTERPAIPRPRKNWKQVREEKENRWERRRELQT